MILLLGCWILTGVFINRNFINKVNRAGNVMVDKSGKIVEIVKHKVVHAHGQPSDAAGDAAAVAAESAGNPGERPARRSADTPAVESAVKAEPEVVVRRPEPELAVQRPVPEMPRAVRTPGPAAAGTPAAPQAARRDADDNPFVELGPDGMPIVPEAPQAAEAAASDDDGEFTEVDLSRPEGRLVIGPSGLVELERPAARRHCCPACCARVRRTFHRIIPGRGRPRRDTGPGCRDALCCRDALRCRSCIRGAAPRRAVYRDTRSCRGRRRDRRGQRSPSGR